MYKWSLLLIVLFCNLHASAQYHSAYLDEYQNVKTKPIAIPKQLQLRNGEDGFAQIDGFPKNFVASKANKNFRNVTLADLDDDGTDEIIVAIASTLYVFKNGELLWKKGIIGLGIYPPSIADIDNNGSLDIIQVTGGNQQVGGIYVVDKAGNDLPGWPRSLDDNWILTSPAISDVDDDGQLEIIVNELSNPKGKVHILKSNGENFSDDWPVLLDNTGAVTPSIGDIDKDGEKELVFCSTRSIYVLGLDGLPESGWPIQNSSTKFSFQSPILVDFENDGFMEIVGSAHGDAPEYYVFNYDGTYREGWPIAVPEASWTFSPPTIYRKEGEDFLFMSRPVFQSSDISVLKDMFYAFNGNGQLKPGFPISQIDGCEGLITIADVDNDNEMEVLFSSNTTDEESKGYIHAYELDGSAEATGFPIRPKGLTYMNGATLGDVNGDGKMNAVTLSYTIDFDGTDSLYLNVYDLVTPYSKEKIAWGTYKGSNSRDGLFPPTELLAPAENLRTDLFDFRISPNPVSSSTIHLHINSNAQASIHVQVFDSVGRLVSERTQQNVHVGQNILDFAFAKLEKGIYFVRLMDSEDNEVVRKLVKI